MKTSDDYYIAFGNLNNQDIQVCVEISSMILLQREMWFF